MSSLKGKKNSTKGIYTNNKIRIVIEIFQLITATIACIS